MIFPAEDAARGVFRSGFRLPIWVRVGVVTNVQSVSRTRADWTFERRDLPTATCPTMLDVAHFEAGDLVSARAVEVQYHLRHCARCKASLAEIRQARHEILGLTAVAQLHRSRRAAAEIQFLLRRRLH